MSMMDLWFNINMSVLVIIVVMLVLEVITRITDEYPNYGATGAVLVLFFVISGTLNFIVSVVWGV